MDGGGGGEREGGKERKRIKGLSYLVIVSTVKWGLEKERGAAVTQG